MPEQPGPSDAPGLVFTVDYDARTAMEIEAKGWCGCARVQSPRGEFYPVFFMDPVRLQQDLESGGDGYLAECGLIVVPAVTKANMEEAMLGAWREGFFEHLRPLPQ